MPHCRACDKNLNDFESTRKIVREDKTVEYVDLCNKCFRESDLPKVANVIERPDLLHEEDISEDESEFYDVEEL